MYIATFVVSGYASSYYRTGGKPFNPVLGETYECDRPDKGFRFVAEQVCTTPQFCCLLLEILQLITNVAITVTERVNSVTSLAQLILSFVNTRSAITRRFQLVMQSLKTSSTGKVVEYGHYSDQLQ